MAHEHVYIQDSKRIKQTQKYLKTQYLRGWSGGAKVLGKLPVPGRPTLV